MAEQQGSTRFIEWVQDFGAARLARVSGAQRVAVRRWLEPDSRLRPSRKHAELIVAISGLAQYRCPDGAPLRLQDVGQ
jgi:hypothetical protein